MRYKGLSLENLHLPRRAYIALGRQEEALGRQLNEDEIVKWLEKYRKYILEQPRLQRTPGLKWLFKKYEKKERKQSQKREGYPGIPLSEYARRKGYNTGGFISCVRRFCPGEVTKEWFDKAEEYYAKNFERRQLRKRIREFLPNKRDEDLAMQRVESRGWSFYEAINASPKDLWKRRK